MTLKSGIIIRSILFSFLILVIGSLIIELTKTNLHLSEFLILSLSFASISLLSVFIFTRGLAKDPASRTMHIIVAISLKFLLELILSLVWFFVSKKTSAPSLILFFVLYLGFSLYLVNLMLNTLRHKSL